MQAFDKFDINDIQLAVYLDSVDPLKDFRQQFYIPKVKNVQGKVHDPELAADQQKESKHSIKNDLLAHDDECVYFCGNSLGLQPKNTQQLLQQELQVWQESGVHGHFNHRFNRPWVSTDENLTASIAKIVGALESEVAILNSLTVNLHLLMISFYRPSATRYKILIESHAFPSDIYAVKSQLSLHGFGEDALMQLKPRSGEFLIHTEDILKILQEQGESIALVLFSGVQYYSGQLFDIPQITAAGHVKGCKVGFDLAHAVGNVKLNLHQDNVDFAVWCSYKYLNSGPGGIAGLFLNQKYHTDPLVPRLYGWWSNKESSRFQMNEHLDPIESAQIYRMSNPCVLAVTALYASLQVFDQTSMEELVKKSQLLTTYLERLLLQTFPNPSFQVITPSQLSQRGCQISLIFDHDIKQIFSSLMQLGVVCDERKPNCIRIAAVPLYNSFLDVYKFVQLLKVAIQTE